jgi:hypothetical protein
MKRFITIMMCSTMLVLAGCASEQRQKQLERVAKDWCLTIRASQVVPVYPLTEDLKPGDMFLVQTPIPKQAKEYKKRGFLPLDLHMARLSNPVNFEYPKFYKKSYGINGHINTPYHWQFPPDGYPPPWQFSSANVPLINDPNRHKHFTDWPSAPRAAFPSYTFTVESSGEIHGALPIKGIPVGLSMIQAEKATGEVEISDAYTYGITFDDLVSRVHSWAAKAFNRDILDNIRTDVINGEPFLDKAGRFIFSPITGETERTVYLRVINRVYLTGKVIVSLRNTTSGNVWTKLGWFGEDKGSTVPEEKNKAAKTGPSTKSAKSTDPNQPTKPKQPANENELIERTESAQKNNIKAALDMFNALLEEGSGAKAGGELSAMWATDRSIILSETFDRPLVIGYLGFDFPVMKGGDLGAPIATLNQLSGKGSVDTTPFTEPNFFIHSIAKRLKAEEAAKVQLKAANDNILQALKERYRKLTKPDAKFGTPAPTSYPSGKAGTPKNPKDFANDLAVSRVPGETAEGIMTHGRLENAKFIIKELEKYVEQ